jgi:hypothetical protein
VSVRIRRLYVDELSDCQLLVSAGKAVGPNGSG